MAQCNSTSTCVELLHGDVQSLLAGECLCSKGFVDFDLKKLRAINSRKDSFFVLTWSTSPRLTPVFSSMAWGWERCCDYHDMKVRWLCFQLFIYRYFKPGWMEPVQCPWLLARILPRHNPQSWKQNVDTLHEMSDVKKVSLPPTWPVEWGCAPWRPPHWQSSLLRLHHRYLGVRWLKLIELGRDHIFKKGHIIY